MIADPKLVERVDAFVDGKHDVDVDTASLIATYKAKRKAEDDRGVNAFARAIAKRVDLSSVGSGAGGKLTKADLLAEIDRRNEGRDEADLIVPDGTKNADLEAALKADDERA